MSECSVCSGPAVWTFSAPGISGGLCYCARHLPDNLRESIGGSVRLLSAAPQPSEPVAVEDRTDVAPAPALGAVRARPCPAPEQVKGLVSGMRITTVPAVQVHAVPSTVGRPRGPFPAELFGRPEVVTDYEPQPDGGGDPVPEDGTAQNGFRHVRWYRCRDCLTAVPEYALDDHTCEEPDDGDAT